MAVCPKSLAEFDGLFFISLKRSTERRALVESQIRRHKLENAVIIDAVDGRAMDCQLARQRGEVADGSQMKRLLHPGEIGCALSHRKAWQEMLNRRLQSVIVFEDDAVLRDDCLEVSQRILREVPEDWDVIYLHSSCAVGSGTGSDAGRQRLSSHLLTAHQEGGGAAAYAIRNLRGAVQYLIDRATPIAYPADGVTNWLSASWDNRHWNAYIADPFLVETRGDLSSIWENRRSSLFERTVDRLKKQLREGISRMKRQ